MEIYFYFIDFNIIDFNMNYFKMNDFNMFNVIIDLHLIKSYLN